MAATAQVAGLSNDKLVALNPASIGTRTAEFEPGFGYIWSKHNFGNDGKKTSINPANDSIVVMQALAFRLTYGFAKNLEIGTVITSSLDAFGLGIKYNFFSKEAFSGAAFLGSNFSNNSDFVVRNTGIFGKTLSLVGGFAFTNRFGESKRLSIDYDLQYQNTFDQSTSYSDDVFLAADLGYELKKEVQLITGLNYVFHNFKNGDPNAWRLTWNTGLTVHPGEMFSLIVNVPIDVAGRQYRSFCRISNYINHSPTLSRTRFSPCISLPFIWIIVSQFVLLLLI